METIRCRYIKSFLIISALCVFNTTILNSKKSSTANCNYELSTKDASFVGGMDNMHYWFQNNVKYPNIAYMLGNTAEVGVFFDIEVDGTIDNIWLYSEGDPEFDNEAYRLIETMPNWYPEYKNGKPIKSTQSFILKFQIPTIDDKDKIKIDLQDVPKEGNAFIMLEQYANTHTPKLPPNLSKIILSKDIRYALTKASFPDGINGLMDYLSKNIQYPPNAYQAQIEGKVVVAFKIGKDGKVSNTRVSFRLDPQLDQEALRVVEEMPNWIPASIFGKPINSYYYLPVTFRLSKKDQ